MSTIEPGMMVYDDLGRLHRVLSVDAEKGTALVKATLTQRDRYLDLSSLTQHVPATSFTYPGDPS